MADYCTDVFTMVEDNEDSYRMWQGLVGPHYVPIMSNDGTLRWTNNGGLPNPSEVNLMGPQGAGIRIAGIRESAEELPATAPAGDIWLVGEGSPYEGYSFTGGEWLYLGPLTVGPAGPPGPQGDDYELTEADKAEIAEISESLLLSELDNDPLEIRYGGTGAHDLAGAKENLGIGDIEDKLGTWPLGTDAQDVAGAINEMIGEISLQVADIQQLKDNFAGEFSPTSTYAVGAYVVYGGAFWRCTTAVTTAGSWTGASNWTHVTAGGEFEAVRGIIGTSPLNTTAQTLTGAINEHETDISDLDTALSGKVSKAGDTMSGALTLNVPLAIASGGTGASSAANARTNLGLGSVATESIVPLAKGGTGETTANDALVALNGLSKLTAYYQDDVIDTMTDGTALVRTSGLVNTSLYNALGDNYAYVVQIFYGAIGSTRNRLQLAFPYGKTINKIAWREYNSQTSPAWGDWYVIRNGTESVTGITVPQSATGVATMPSVSAVRTGNTVQVTVDAITLDATPPSVWANIATGLPIPSEVFYTHFIAANGSSTKQLRVRVSTSGQLQVAYGQGSATYVSCFTYVCND